MLFAIPSVVAQPHSLLQDFSGYQQGNKLILRWTFKSGSFCDGMRIGRSSDGLIFEQLAEIPGICGNPQSAYTYSFADSLALPNAVNYYRLELGNYGFSEVLPVEFLKPGKNGFVVIQEAGGLSQIVFDNQPGRTGKAVIYSASGKRISETAIHGNRLSLGSDRWAPGVYLLLLVFNDQSSVSGNFILH